MRALPSLSDPRDFISERQKAVLEASCADAAVAALPEIFAADFSVTLNGQRLGWPWLEQHVRDFHAHIDRIHVEVTHAVTDGQVLMERHTVSGVSREQGEPWLIEVMAAYELSAEHKIRTWYELAQMRTGEYTGW
jgi:hypothetical protein